VTLNYSRVEPNVSLNTLVCTPGLNHSNFDAKVNYCGKPWGSVKVQHLNISIQEEGSYDVLNHLTNNHTQGESHDL